MSEISLDCDIWVKELDDGWLQIYDGREVIATAWNLWSVRVFVDNYKANKIKRFYASIKPRRHR